MEDRSLARERSLKWFDGTERLIARGTPTRCRSPQMKDAIGETSNAGFAALLSPIIASGRCAAPICSRRIEESVQLIANSLDLVERVLRGIERWAERTGNSHGTKISHESLDMVH